MPRLLLSRQNKSAKFVAILFHEFRRLKNHFWNSFSSKIDTLSILAHKYFVTMLYYLIFYGKCINVRVWLRKREWNNVDRCYRIYKCIAQRLQGLIWVYIWSSMPGFTWYLWSKYYIWMIYAGRYIYDYCLKYISCIYVSCLVPNNLIWI